VAGPHRLEYRVCLGEAVLLPVYGAYPARCFHDRTFGGTAEIHGSEAGVVDQPGDNRLCLGIVAADPLDHPLGP